MKDFGLKIAGIGIRVDEDHSSEAQSLAEDLSAPFSAFRCPEAAPSLTWHLCEETAEFRSAFPEAGWTGPRGASPTEVRIGRAGEGHFFLSFPGFAVISGMDLEKGAGKAGFFLAKNPEGASIKESETFNDGSLPPGSSRAAFEFFNAARFAFLFAAEEAGIFAIHSSSVLVDRRLYLISAPSGTGKSTLADHVKAVSGTPVINGDVNLLRQNKEDIFVPGSPWCGTSGIYNAETYLLGGIAFLERGEENRVEDLSPFDRQIAFFSRLISPHWDEGQTDACLAAAAALTDKVPVFRYFCRDEDDAGRVLVEYLRKQKGF